MSPSRKAARPAPKPTRATKAPAKKPPAKRAAPAPKPSPPPEMAKPAPKKKVPKAAPAEVAPPPPPPPAEIRVDAIIAAPAHRVWAALTSPDEINRWFTDRCEFEARLNGRVLYAWFGATGEPPAYVNRSRFDPAAEARVEAWEPRTRITLRPSTRWPGLVTFLLADDAGRTKVTIEHTGWAEKDAWFKEQEKGWREAVELLKLYLERPEAEFDAHLAKLEARGR